MYKGKKRGYQWTILLVLGAAVIVWVITAFANMAETNNVRVFWSHEFPNCPGGEENHFDNSVLLYDSLSGGALPVGGEWGVGMSVDYFANSLHQSSNSVIGHEMGLGLGMQDYCDRTGSTPGVGSVAIVGSTSGESTITIGDTRLIRRIWKELRSLRGW